MRSRAVSVHLYRRGWLFCLLVTTVMLAAMTWLPGLLVVAPAAQWAFAVLVLSMGALQFLRHPPKHTLALMHGHVDWKYGYLAWWNPAAGPAALAADDEMEAWHTWEPALVAPHARWRPLLAAASRALWVLTVPLATLLTFDAIFALCAGNVAGLPQDSESSTTLWVIVAANTIVLRVCYGLCESLLRLSTVRMGIPGVRRAVAHQAALHAFSKTAGFMHPDTGRVHHARSL